MIRWLIRSYEKEKDYITLVRILEKAIGFFENRADNLYLAIICNELGATYYNLSMFSQALVYYFKAKETFQQLNSDQQKEDRDLLWLIQDIIAIVYEASGERKKAYAQALDNIILVKILNNISHLAGAYSLAGSTALAIDKDSVGLGYLLEAMKLRKEANFPQWTSETATFLGDIYINKKNYQEALIYY